MEADLNRGWPNGPSVRSGPQAHASTLVLPQILDLTQARPLRDNLAALLDQDTIRLDASAVERMSTPCAQVLLAAGRTAGNAGISFTINASPVFRAALADLGLQPEFSKWMD